MGARGWKANDERLDFPSMTPPNVERLKNPARRSCCTLSVNVERKLRSQTAFLAAQAHTAVSGRSFGETVFTNVWGSLEIRVRKTRRLKLRATVVGTTKSWEQWRVRNSSP